MGGSDFVAVTLLISGLVPCPILIASVTESQRRPERQGATIKKSLSISPSAVNGVLALVLGENKAKSLARRAGGKANRSHEIRRSTGSAQACGAFNRAWRLAEHRSGARPHKTKNAGCRRSWVLKPACFPEPVFRSSLNCRLEFSPAQAKPPSTVSVFLRIEIAFQTRYHSLFLK